MSEHALLSASSAKRWLNCTPSARLEQHRPDTAGIDAQKGTLAHAIAELKLRKYSTRIKPSKYNSELKKLQIDPLFEPEMLTNTDMYMDHIKRVVTAYPADKRPDIFIERRVDYGHVAPEGFGTADCIIVGDGHLHVIDYKNGAGVRVSVQDNPQLMLYALGALYELELLYFIDQVHLTIVQPRIGGIDTWDTTPNVLGAWASAIGNQAQMAYEGKGKCVVGDWCRFCKVAIDCTAQRKTFDRFNDLTATPVKDVPNADLSWLLERIPIVADWMNALREHSLSLLLSGGSIDGWKPVEGKRGNRQWTDQSAAFDAIIQSGFEKDMLYERKPRTLTAIEKDVGKATFEQVVGAFIMREPGKPSLAAESDKRPALAVKRPEDVFEPVIGADQRKNENQEESLL